MHNYIRKSDYIYLYKTLKLAVKTNDQGWVWFKKVWVVEDDRPIEYLGLLSAKYYFVDKEKAKVLYEEFI